MHDLNVIVERQSQVVIRGFVEAFYDGNQAKAVAIARANQDLIGRMVAALGTRTTRGSTVSKEV